MAKDPVCGMEVNPDEAAASFEYEGEKYFFCAEACKEKFKNDPKNFIDKN